MMKLHVRDILKVSCEEAWDIIPWASVNDKIKLVFDNNEELVVTGRGTVFSQYFWNYHRMYPKTQVLPKHHILDKYISKQVYLDLLSNAYWQCYYDNEAQGVSREVLMRIAYQYGTNRIYNMIATRLSPWITSVANHDILEVVNHERIKDAVDNVGAEFNNPKYTIDECHDIITDVLMNDENLIRNPLAYAARARLVDINQIKQCVGPRGNPTDVDDFIFSRTPILPSFYRGLTELVDVLTESRSAAKAHYYQKSPMEKSEYLNRSTQLLCMSLQRLHMTDCGSKGYISFQLGKNDIPMILGKKMLTPEGNEVWATRENLTPMIGKVIKLRSILYCNHPDESGVCLHCFGAIGFSIPHGTNIGYCSSAIILGDTGQNLLSAKHLVASASGNEFHIMPDMKPWIARNERAGMLGLNPMIAKQKVNLIINKESGQGLNDIQYVENVNILQKSLVTKFTNLVFEKQTKHHTEYHDIDLCLDGNFANLTHEALQYIKDRGFTINNNDDFVVPLDKWNYKDPFIEIPLKQYSTVDFMMSVDRAITGNNIVTGKSRESLRGTRIVDYNTPEEALIFFYGLINSKLSCSMSHIEVIVYCLMCADPDRNDFSLPRKGAPNKLVPYTKIMRNRSLAPFLAFERQFKTLTNPHTYLLKHRAPHPMDAIFVPPNERTVYI